MKKFNLVKSMLMITLVSVSGIAAAQTTANSQTPVLTKTGTFSCGKQPKQVLFSPDSKYILMPLLDDTGFDIFSVEEKKVIKRICPPESQKLGFAEGLFIPEKNAFFVSQMTTGKLYEYSYPDFTYRRAIETHGTWSKFIVYSPEKNLLAVSNWVSNDISIINYDTGTIVRKINTGAAPRGMAFLNGGNSIISLSFDSGKIERFEVATGTREKLITIENAAMRHIAVDSQEQYAYISDMYHREILKLDLASFKIVGRLKVFNNPNTIDLLDDKWLFVSCRGPNNQVDYTLRSPVNGQIWILDTTTMTCIKTFEGGNQPTGLDVSPDGKMLCFSNFQDANVELYTIE